MGASHGREGEGEVRALRAEVEELQRRLAERAREGQKTEGEGEMGPGAKGREEQEGEEEEEKCLRARAVAAERSSAASLSTQSRGRAPRGGRAVWDVSGGGGAQAAAGATFYGWWALSPVADAAFLSPQWQAEALRQLQSAAPLSCVNDVDSAFLRTLGEVYGARWRLVRLCQTGAMAVHHVWALAVRHLERGRGRGGGVRPQEARVLVASGSYISGTWPWVGDGELGVRHELPGLRASPDTCSVVPFPYYAEYGEQYRHMLKLGARNPDAQCRYVEGLELSELEAACLAYLEREFEGDRRVAVLMFEYVRALTMLGLRPQFLARLRALCTQHNVLLVADEIMTNVRTGMPFVHQYLGETCVPDVCLAGKAVQCGMVLQRDDDSMVDVEGVYTAVLDRVQLFRVRTILQQILERRLVDHARTAGWALERRYRELGITPVGIGLMFTFYGRTHPTGTVLFNGMRFLPHLSYMEHDREQILQDLRAVRLPEGRSLERTLQSEREYVLRLLNREPSKQAAVVFHRANQREKMKLACTNPVRFIRMLCAQAAVQEDWTADTVASPEAPLPPPAVGETDHHDNNRSK